MYGRNHDFCLRSIIVKLWSKDFVIQTLKKKKKLNGSDFMKWVSVLMAFAKSCADYCGWLSESFAVEESVKAALFHHCPLFLQ